MRRFRLFTIILLLLGCGCAALQPAQPPPAASAYGPFPEQYRRLVTDYMAPFLLNPESSSYTNWQGPGRGFVTTATGIFYGYRVCTSLDFRNRAGVYTGGRTYLFLISNDRVVLHEGGHPAGTPEADLLARVCNDL